MSSLKVWIDQDLCTGDGLCTEIAPSVFEMHTDGLAYVKEHSWPSIMGPSGGTEPVYKMAEGMALIPDSEIESVIESAEDCPGECIFIESV